MRFMLTVVVPNTEAESDWGPTAEQVAAMTKYNEELTKAGVLLALDGLQASSKGARVHFSGGTGSVTDGPFTEAKELVGGYWIVDVRSKDEAVAWATRAPMADGDTIEVRQMFEMADHSEELQEAGRLSQTPPEQTVAS